MHQAHCYLPPRQTDGLRPPLLILLHGKGANEEDLFSFATHFDPRFAILSLRAPHEMAPGYYRWYERHDLPDGKSWFDEAEILASRTYLLQALKDAVMATGADPQRVFVFGFSQGAAMALGLLLTAPQRLRAVVSIAGRLLPALAPLAAEARALRQVTVLLQHGDADDLVLPQESVRACQLLAEFAVPQALKNYSVGHTISPNMLRDAVTFLRAQLDRAAILEI